MAHDVERSRKEFLERKSFLESADLSFSFEKMSIVPEMMKEIRKCQEEAALSQICKLPRFQVKEMIFNEPATIIMWQDGTKTVVKCSDEDSYSPEAGVALCYMKKLFNNKGNYNNILRTATEQYYEDVSEDDLTIVLNSLYESMRNAVCNILNIFKDKDEKNPSGSIVEKLRELAEKIGEENGKTSVEECSTVDTVSEDKTSDGADVSGRPETVD